MLKLVNVRTGFKLIVLSILKGLKYIEEIASQGNTDLRIDLEAADGAKAYETFDRFSLSPGPAFTLHIGSTIDKQNSEYKVIIAIVMSFLSLLFCLHL